MSAARGIVKGLAIALALLVGSCAIFLDFHKIVWYTLFPSHLFYELEAELTVDGQPITVKGVVECLWVQHARPLLPGFRFSRYEPLGGLLAARLPSGGSVAVLPKVGCFSYDKDLPHKRYELKPPSYPVPIIFLTDDDDNPARIEKILSDDYFSDPAARVQFHGLFATPLEWGVRTDPAAEVGWLRVAEENGRREYRGFVVRVTSREEWQEDSGLAPLLKTISETSSIVGRIYPRQVSLGKGLIRPLPLKGGYWDYQPSGTMPDGLVLLYPRKHSKMPRPGTVERLTGYDVIFGNAAKLSVEGEKTDIDHLTHLRAYEPNSGDLMLIINDYLRIDGDGFKTFRVRR